MHLETATEDSTAAAQADSPEPTVLEKMRADEKLRKAVKKAADRIVTLEQSRKAINQEMSAVRESVKELGINGHAFKAAVARYKLEEADRAERELSYRACLIALSIEDQIELFESPKAETTH